MIPEAEATGLTEHGDDVGSGLGAIHIGHLRWRVREPKGLDIGDGGEW